MSTALIVVDMLNRYEHDDADSLMESVRDALPSIRQLIDQARRAGVLTVYVNDNHGDWTLGAADLCQWALEGPHADLVEPIIPPERTPFLVKARHSAFYETQLEYLLRQEGIERLLLAGQVTEQCILHSALDAYVRHFELVVVRKALAHIHEDLATAALRMMERNMGAHMVDEPAEAISTGSH